MPVEYLFTYWDNRFALKSFLTDFPEVSSDHALAALRKRAESEIPTDSVDGLMGGMPVFRGTRVPVEYLFNQLKRGGNIDDFLKSIHHGQERIRGEGSGRRLASLLRWQLMRILLDENMPLQFRHNFPGHDVRSAQFMDWLGRHNGELVRLRTGPLRRYDHRKTRQSKGRQDPHLKMSG